MTRERFYDERDFEDGNSPGEYYEYDPEDDWADGQAPVESFPDFEALFRREAPHLITQQKKGGN